MPTANFPVSSAAILWRSPAAEISQASSTGSLIPRRLKYCAVGLGKIFSVGLRHSLSRPLPVWCITPIPSRSKPPVGKGVGYGSLMMRPSESREAYCGRILPTTSITLIWVMRLIFKPAGFPSSERSKGVPYPARYFPARLWMCSGFNVPNVST